MHDEKLIVTFLNFNSNFNHHFFEAIGSSLMFNYMNQSIQILYKIKKCEKRSSFSAPESGPDTVYSSWPRNRDYPFINHKSGWGGRTYGI